jgi:hypothetical protein
MTTDTMLAQLTKARAERKDELDLPRTMTQREVNAYVEQTIRLDRRIAAIRTAADTLAALPTLDADTKWLAHLNTWRTTLCDELMTIKSPIRDRDTKERAERLTWSIKLIDFGLGISSLGIVTLAASAIGPLMAAAGYAIANPELRGPNGWRGHIKDTEQRIKELTKRRAEAQAGLDVLLRTDEERATQEAEDKVFYAAMNTMHCKADSTGTRLVAFTLDGDELPIDAMTPAQRKALERFEAAHFRPREVVSV